LVTGVIRHKDENRVISVGTMRSLVSLGRKNENFGRQIDFARQTRPKSRRFYYQFRGSLAHQVLQWLRSNGYQSVDGVNQAVYREPIKGIAYNKKNNNEFDIIIGTNA